MISKIELFRELRNKSFSIRELQYSLLRRKEDNVLYIYIYNQIVKNPFYLLDFNLQELGISSKHYFYDKLKIYLDNMHNNRLKNKEYLDIVYIFKKLVDELKKENNNIDKKMDVCIYRRTEIKRILNYINKGHIDTNMVNSLVKLLKNKYSNEVIHDLLVNIITPPIKEQEEEILEEEILEDNNSEVLASEEAVIENIDNEEIIEEKKDNNIENLYETNLEYKKMFDLFAKYGYDFRLISNFAKNSNIYLDDEEISPMQYILKVGNYDNIEKILELFSKYKISLLSENSRSIARILVLSKSKNVENIVNKHLEMTHKITKNISCLFDFILKHPTVTIQNNICYNEKHDDKNVFNGCYDSFMINFTFFVDNCGDDYEFSKLSKTYASKLFRCFQSDSRLIQKTFSILSKYGFSPNEAVDLLIYNGVNNSSTLERMDWFIELASYPNINMNGIRYAKENMSCLKTGKASEIMQIINASRDNNNYLFEMKEQVFSLKKNLINQYRSDCFINPSDSSYSIPLYSFDGEDEELNAKDVAHDICFDEGVFSNEYIDELEIKYKKDDLIYEFNGVCVSRLKVLRICSSLMKKNMEINYNNLLYAITYGSLNTEEMYNNIKEKLNNIFGLERGSNDRFFRKL